MPAIEAVGNMIGNDEILTPGYSLASPPSRQGLALPIMACGCSQAFAVDEEAGEGITEEIAGRGSDRLHEQEIRRHMIALPRLAA